MNIRIFDPSKNKQVFIGKYHPEHKLFVKNVNSRHYMVKEKGYGFQEEVVDLLGELDCKTIRLVSPTKTLEFEYPLLVDVEPRNYGHGLQRFVPVDKMRTI